MKLDNSFKQFPRFVFLISMVLVLASCGGGGGNDDEEEFTVGGNISGLNGSVELENNGGDTLSVSANGGFTFSANLTDGSGYAVTVSAQPDGQTCNVNNGSGTVSSANVSDITVTCTTDVTLFTVGGDVSGLIGTVELENNGGDTLSIDTNGVFTFATSVVDGGSYLVTVSTHPVGQVCTVSNGNGLIAAANISDVSVVCADIVGPPGTAAIASLAFDIKIFRFSWTDVVDATFYRILEDSDGVSGFSQVGGDINASTQIFEHSVSLYQRINASYILQSCNGFGCTDAPATTISGTLTDAIGYFKASNTDVGDEFGLDVALSADGTTMVVGAQQEASDANGIDGDESDDLAPGAGAAYVYVKIVGSWMKQAYIKADASALGENFGASVSLSADGNVLAVGTPFEGSGNVYIFTRSGMNWTKQDKVNATSGGAGDFFGDTVSLSDDGSTLAVGARAEDSESQGLAGDPGLDGAAEAGAAYIFVESGGSWAQQQYFKADNAEGGDLFGSDVSLNSDGNTFVVGASDEDSAAGAAYVFTRSGVSWSQQAYIKADVAGMGDNFGISVSLSDDGNTLAVGAVSEDSMVTVINGDDTDDNAASAGAAYVFTRGGVSWTQQAYIKASNTDAADNFGRSVSLSANGDALAVGAEKEQSNATGINGDESNNSLNGTNGSGAAYVYTRSSGVWSQQAYVKATNSGDNDFYGTALELSGDGQTLAVGADTEDSDSTGIGGDNTNSGATGSGAVYLY